MKSFSSFKFLFVILTFFLLSENVKSQTQISTVEFFAEVTNETDSLNSVFSLTSKIHLSDTLNIAKVKLKIGNALNSGNVFMGEVNYHSPLSNLPSTQTYNRNDKVISWNIGTIQLGQIYYYEVNIFDFQDNLLDQYIIQN